MILSMKMKELEQTGLALDGVPHPLHIHIQCFVCDAPARAFVKNVKAHSGYFGCEKCCQRGVWNGKVTFSSTDSHLRTDADFRSRNNPEHHHGVSPVETLSVGMVTQFPLDYMHLICLGVMRRLIWLWTKSPLEKNLRLSAMSVQRLSDSLLQLKSHVPSQFARKCRPVSEIDRWKATEFRQFLLYCGPVVLKGILPDALYNNFLLLSVGIFFLVSLSFC